MERKEKNPDGLDADIRHIADILSKVKSPWSRYQLTMIIELCADKLETVPEKAATPAARKRAPKRVTTRAKAKKPARRKS